MKKLLGLTLAALVATACTDIPTGLTASDAEFNKGVSEKVSATATFTINAGQTVVTYLTTPKNNQGSCNATNGAWTNNGGHTSGPNHEQCTNVATIPGSNVVITFSDAVNYVTPKSGNINLNFSSVCVYDEEGECTFPGRSVHYQKNHDLTTGSGTLYGAGDDGSVWAIDLSQILRAGNADIVARSFTGLLATEVGGSGSYATATLSW
jgi:hypothetical protein